MAYAIEFERRALRQFTALPRRVQIRLRPRIDALAEEPRPRGAVKIRGEENSYRLRVGDYRIIYEVQDKALLILVIKVGHRRDVYQQR